MQAVLERLEKLERQNRRLKQVAVVGLALVGTLVLMGQATQKPRTVEADEFILRWPDGEVAATLGFTGQQPQPGEKASGWPAMPSLVFYGPKLKGHPLMQQARLDVGGLRFYELFTGKEVTALGDVTGLELRGKHDEYLTLSTAGLQINNPADGAFISAFGNHVGAMLDATEDGPKLEVSDAAGFKCILGKAQLETPSTGESHTTSAASLAMFDKDGKVIWRTP
jgi:hypothetical protein